MTKTAPLDADTALAARGGPDLLRQRIEKEQGKERAVRQKGRRFFFNENRLSFRNLFRLGLQTTGLLSVGRRNALDLQIREHTLAVVGLPNGFDGYRVLHLSDLHLEANVGLPGVLIDRIRQVKADVCLISGDFRARSFGPIDQCLAQLKQVVEHIEMPIYAILGNHDSIRMVPGIEALGIRLLLNESVQLQHKDHSLALVGVDDPHFFQSNDLGKACANIPEDHCKILLVHSPEVIHEAEQMGFGAYVCGHTHGGQICLPGGMPLISNSRAAWRFSSGAWQYKRMAGYTSRGSGVSIVDVRFNCPPEVTVHTLRVA